LEFSPGLRSREVCWASPQELHLIRFSPGNGERMACSHSERQDKNMKTPIQ
jgi:hypothetical protein